MQNKFCFCRTDDALDLPLPSYMSDGAAGMDLYANVHADVVIRHGEIKLIPTGVRISIPHGFEAQVRPRSGLALRHGITLINSPGTVDSDYRGEIKVPIINFGNEDFTISRGLRFAQMVICRVETPVFTEVDTLDETERAERGFGHTGV